MIADAALWGEQKCVVWCCREICIFNEQNLLHVLFVTALFWTPIMRKDIGMHRCQASAGVCLASAGVNSFPCRSGQGWDCLYNLSNISVKIGC